MLELPGFRACDDYIMKERKKEKDTLGLAISISHTELIWYGGEVAYLICFVWDVN